VGELEFVKRFYAKVEFKVTHSIKRLIEVKAPSRKEAANILSDRLDDDVSDILETVSDELYIDENIETHDAEVVEWGTNPDDLSTHYRHPVRSYSTED
jgi:predicted outer membrane protein